MAATIITDPRDAVAAELRALASDAEALAWALPDDLAADLWPTVLRLTREARAELVRTATAAGLTRAGAVPGVVQP